MQPAEKRDSLPEAPSAPATPLPPTAARRLRAECVAGIVVRAGGLAVVLSLVGILAFLAAEVLPLLGEAEVKPVASLTAATGPLRAVSLDPDRSRVAVIDERGRVSVLRVADGSLESERQVPFEGALVELAATPNGEALLALARDGRIVRLPLVWNVRWEGERRVTELDFAAAEILDLELGGASPLAFAMRADARFVAAAAALPDGTLALLRTQIATNDFTGAREEQTWRARVKTPAPIHTLALASDGRQLFAADASGGLHRYLLTATGLDGPVSARTGRPIRTLAYLLGGRSVVAGHEDGTLDIWYPVTTGRARDELVRAHQLPSLGGAIRALAPSARTRSFAAVSEDGRIGLYHATSARVLWTGQGPSSSSAPPALSLAPKGDALVVARGAEVALFSVVSPHPEASLAAYFAPIHYEDYAEPTWVWQSTGGSDQFEPKLSLTPLVVGTLKGTFYALLFAVPLAVLGALYTSQLMHPSLQRIVKPTIEIMASLPSVVLGFLAGLWLAPRLERYFPGVALALVAGPPLAIAGGALFAALPRRISGRLPAGTEVFSTALVIALGAAACLASSSLLERVLFAGDFPSWLRAVTGLDYDQRNALVAGIAMGFAVIPIVFSIAEESVTNVPRTLTAGSLALGATRWQTLARVVLPAASPGIFAAVMIGLGRAVGETMIVLMATGNTPLLDWSPFNGLRSLSANIAVEIPEAPHGGTLYRTLFLSALLLFGATFVLNAGADLVRERLRRRYSGTQG